MDVVNAKRDPNDRIQQIHSVQTSYGPIVQCKPLLTADSKYLLTASGSSIKVFSTTSGNLLREHLCHEAKVIGVIPSGVVDDQDVSCDENGGVIPSGVADYQYVSCDENGTVCFWDLDRKKEKKEIEKYVVINQERREVKIVSFDFCRSRKELFVVLQKHEKTQKGHLVKVVLPSCTKQEISSDVLLGTGQFSVSKSGDYIAHVSQDGLCIIPGNGDSRQGRTRIRHLVGSRTLTCLAFHPSQDVIATGDISGRILLWYEFLSSSPQKLELHWHQVPVADLAFSFTGTELYSGGGECVLVKWQLTEQMRYFLPRLGTDIKFVATDTQNNFVVASHWDNAITVISAKEYRVEGVIQGLSMNTANTNPFPAGMVYDPRTRAIVLNGRTGYVQFYDFHHNKQLCHLDITMSNFYNQERNQEIQNTQVERVAVSPDGHWMATFEYREDIQASSELRLKFWNFNEEDQNWHLNTSIDKPHDKYINGIVFQPTPLPGCTPLCVSCGDDGKFKVWKEIDTSDIYGKNSSWDCSGVGFYRHLPATAINMSPDGSLIAAGFGSILTFWLPQSCHLKGTLSQPYLTEKIKQVEFGRGEGCGTMVVTRTEHWVCAWDLFICALSWRISICSTCLVADPLSSYMALFSEDCCVFVFEPRSSDLVSWQNNFDSVPATSATFIPHLQKPIASESWNKQSALIYINRNQTLKVLEVDVQLSSAKDKIAERVRQLVQETEAVPAPTPFAALIAQTHTSYVNKTGPEQSGSAAFGVKVEKSASLIQQVLNEARVYRIDSFAHLASEFCKKIVPEAVTSEEKQKQEYFDTKMKEKEDLERKTKKKISKRRKKDLHRVTDSDFNDLMSLLDI